MHIPPGLYAEAQALPGKPPAWYLWQLPNVMFLFLGVVACHLIQARQEAPMRAHLEALCSLQKPSVCCDGCLYSAASEAVI